jgi:hypothetical protein
MLTENCCLALPASLLTAEQLDPGDDDVNLSGLLIYGTIISFSMFFKEQEEF